MRCDAIGASQNEINSRAWALYKVAHIGVLAAAPIKRLPNTYLNDEISFYPQLGGIVLLLLDLSRWFELLLAGRAKLVVVLIVGARGVWCP